MKDGSHILVERPFLKSPETFGSCRGDLTLSSCDDLEKIGDLMLLQPLEFHGG